MRSLCLSWVPRLCLRLGSTSNRELGRIGEELAARFLRREGLCILGQRVLTPRGEIDVLAREGGRLVCVEVKTGRRARLPRARGVDLGAWDLYWRPGGRMGWKRLQRLESAARWLECGQRGASEPRIDLVEVLVSLDGRRLEILHHRDVGEGAASGRP